MSERATVRIHCGMQTDQSFIRAAHRTRSRSVQAAIKSLQTKNNNEKLL